MKEVRRRGLLSNKKIRTDVFSVAPDPGALLGNIITSRDASSARLAKALETNYIAAQDAGGRAGRVGPLDYLSVFEWDKSNLITTSYVWSVKLLGRLIWLERENRVPVNPGDPDDRGPAYFLNAATVDAIPNANNDTGNRSGESIAANTQGIILGKFGGFKVKEAISTAIGNCIEWLEAKSKKIANMDIPEIVLAKKKKNN